MTLSPEAKAKALKGSREYKQDKRATSPSFVQKEKLYRKRYAKKKYAQAKIAIAFTKAFPEQYAKWLREGSAVASPPMASQRMVPTMTAMPVQMLPPRPHFTVSGSIPSAQQNENSRLPAADIVSLLGLARD
jgi:hypothetical protein